jgi:hypothetical protein
MANSPPRDPAKHSKTDPARPTRALKPAAENGSVVIIRNPAMMTDSH